MGGLLEYAVRGIPTGCVYALLAVGIVLAYKTSGVFNLAFAAQAYVSAAVFYSVRKDHDWPLWAAAILAIVIVGPLIGVLLERVLFRHLRGATPMAKLVTTLGLLIAMPEIVKLFFGTDAKKNPPPLWWVERTDQWLWPEGSRFVLDAGQVATITATAVAVVGLTVLFRRTGVGLRMRAVVESPRLAELNGVDADRVSTVSWMLSSLLAGLSGVLLAPLFASLNPMDLFTLLVAALAATVVGGLASIPLTLVGGLGLGILQAVLAGTLPTDSVFATGLRPSLPFVVLFVLLLVRPGLRSTREATDPLSTVDPPPPTPTALTRPRWLTLGSRGFGLGVVVVGLWLATSVLDGYWRGLVVSGVLLGIVMLSLTVVTGIGGMVSLSQAAFAAIGGLAAAQLVDRTGMPVLGAVVLGALVAAAVGAVLALPVVRLDGVYLALATLAFALMFQSVLVPLDWVSGGAVPLRVPRPTIGPLDLADDRWFLLFASACLALAAVAVIRIRDGTTGRFLRALQTSDLASASIGISGTRMRVIAFTVAAGIAGAGGGLIVSYTGQANYDRSFQFFYGLVWVSLVVTAGARSVQAAVLSGLGFFLFPALLERLFRWPGNYLDAHPDASGWVASVLERVEPDWALSVAFILFGIGAIAFARHPEGSIEAQTAAVVNRLVRWSDRRRGRRAAGEGRRALRDAAGAARGGSTDAADGAPADGTEAAPVSSAAASTGNGGGWQASTAVRR